MTRLLPDASRITSVLIRAQDEFVDLADDRMYTVLPEGAVYPAARVTAIGGNVIDSRVYWQQSSVVQVECWAVTRIPAFDLAETVRSLIASRFVGSHDIDGMSFVVTGTDVGGIRERVDTDGPSTGMHHLQFDAVIHMHPTQVTGS